MQQAKLTDLICLGLIAFNMAIALHYSVANWIFSTLVFTFTFPIAFVFLASLERKEGGSPNDELQTRIIFAGLMSIVGGLTAWLLI